MFTKILSVPPVTVSITWQLNVKSYANQGKEEVHEEFKENDAFVHNSTEINHLSTISSVNNIKNGVTDCFNNLSGDRSTPRSKRDTPLNDPDDSPNDQNKDKQVKFKADDTLENNDDVTIEMLRQTSKIN